MGSRGEEDSVRRRHLEDWEGKMSMGEPGCPTSVCGRTRRNNWGVRQITQPRVPALEKKASEPLAVKASEGSCTGKTPSLTEEFIGETHRVLEHTETHAPGNHHQKGPI